MQTIMEIGDAVYQGGSQHILHKYAKSDYSFQYSHMTLRGGDYQAMATTGGILYAACHCNDWDFSGDEHLVEPDQLLAGRADQPDRRVRPEHARVPAGVPAERAVRRRGPCGRRRSTAPDVCGPVATSTTATRARTTAASPSSARGLRGTVDPAERERHPDGTSFTINWGDSTDNKTSAPNMKYEVLRDDPTLGTVVSESQFGKGYTVSDVTAPTRFFLRAVDEAGNRSATTTAITLVPPAPQLASFGDGRRDVVLQGRRCRPGLRVAERRHRRLLVGDRRGRARLGRRRRGDRDPGYGDHAVLR